MLNVAERSGSEESGLARVILEYLVRHPRATDTREGIAAWWIQQHQIEHSVETIVRALECLVASGFLLERHGPDQRHHYTINESKLGEITRHLQKIES
jgi:hypothetical protein